MRLQKWAPLAPPPGEERPGEESTWIESHSQQVTIVCYSLAPVACVVSVFTANFRTGSKARHVSRKLSLSLSLSLLLRLLFSFSFSLFRFCVVIYDGSHEKSSAHLHQLISSDFTRVHRWTSLFSLLPGLSLSSDLSEEEDFLPFSLLFVLFCSFLWAMFANYCARLCHSRSRSPLVPGKLNEGARKEAEMATKEANEKRKDGSATRKE